jgi:hypothetical protein
MHKLELDGHRAHSAWDGLYAGHTAYGIYSTWDIEYTEHVVHET